MPHARTDSDPAQRQAPATMALTPLKRRLRELGKRQVDFARQVGQPASRISEMFKGERRVQPNEIAPLAAFLEWPIATLLQAIGGAPPGQGPKSTVASSAGRGGGRQGASAPDLPPGMPALATVRVVGRVQAGFFHEAIESPLDEQYEISIAVPAGFRLAALRGFQVVGPSMNLLYPDGTIVIVVPTIELGEGWRPRTGQRVLVQRRNEWGEFEATVKEIEIRKDRILLCPRSDHPEFSKPWVIEMPEGDGSFDEHSDNIRITGLVVSSVRIEPGV